MIVDRINSYLSTAGVDINEAILEEVANLCKDSFAKQFGKRVERTEPKKPYASSIGKCIRQQAYEVLGFKDEGRELDSRAKMVFFQGDLAEIAMIQLAKVAGCNILDSGKSQVRVELNGIVGRPDGILDEPPGRVLVEAKSMSSFRFRDFERGILDDGYRYQINWYLEALGLNACVVVALNKDAGVVAEKIVNKNPEIVADIKSRIAVLQSVTKETLPARPYKPNEKGFYPWNCCYCSHWKTCLPNAQRVLVQKSYKLKEIKHEATSAGK